MNDHVLLSWLYSNLDEIIDFNGYNNIQEESNNKRGQFDKNSIAVKGMSGIIIDNNPDK